MDKSILRRCGRTVATAALAYGAALAPMGASAQVVERAVAGDPVRIDTGLVAGKLLASGTRGYFGIPYAAAPLGEQRWREPRAAKAWSGVYHADRMAPECMQPLRAHRSNQYFGEEATSEDCLYLNLWTPAGTAKTRRPVVVYIHGGGFMIGSSAMPLYGGEALARKGVVFVNFNYRLGAFGYMSHPDLTRESPHRASGNYGVLDQVAALYWVKRNIDRFGGDANNVTVVGQSAGAIAVSLLQASPLAKGLFHKAVGMSGSAFPNNLGAPIPLESAEQKTGLALQKTLNAKTLAEMRELPGDRILQASLAGGMLVPVYTPVIDGYAIPANLTDIFSQHQQNDVPLMLGLTSDESFFHPISRATSLAQYSVLAQGAFGDRADEFMRLYPAESDEAVAKAAAGAGRDASFGVMMRTWARASLDKGKSPVYAYVFEKAHAYVPGVAISDLDPATAGAYHTAEVPFWLQTLDAFNAVRPTRNWSGADRKLSDQMANALIAFAANGKPGSAALPWDPYDLEKEQVVVLGESVRMSAWPNRDKIEKLMSFSPRAARP